MSIFIQSFLWCVLAFLGVELACYWLPLLGVLFRRPPAVPKAGKELTFCVLTACRDGAACIPGFVKTFRDQNYPAARVRQFLVADHCKDNSAELARSLGMDVYERGAPSIPGKGNAVNEILQNRLQNESFDVLVVMDIDALVEPDFMKRAAAYFQNTPRVISCATFAKNPDETLLGHVGTLIQGVLRLHQEGRAALGLDALIFGSHGYAVSRDALEVLGWRTTTGLIGEDMELRLRCTLRHIPIQYAADLAVYNDVTNDMSSVHQQRLRWNASYPPLIARYTWPLFIQGQIEALLGALLLPAFSTLFLYLTAAAFGLTLAAWKFPVLLLLAGVADSLWLLHGLYFLTLFKVMKVRLSLQDLRGFVVYLGIRALAFFGGFFKIHILDWAPAPHPATKEDAKK